MDWERYYFIYVHNMSHEEGSKKEYNQEAYLQLTDNEFFNIKIPAKNHSLIESEYEQDKDRFEIELTPLFNRLEDEMDFDIKIIYFRKLYDIVVV